MKYLILCEGANEELLINILLDAKKLCLTRDDLIGLKRIMQDNSLIQQ